MSQTELTCRELIEVLDAYVDGELSPSLRALFDEHLTVCPDCVDYVGGYRRTIELARLTAEPDAAVPGDVPEELVAAVLAVRSARR
ncbi:MAG TPA: zf-HC2 domain-containing protein [Candidatus Binatia bacterium]|nr:zf-HC2 domain-containing protein [Candidatus Binatia bacterium]